MLSYVNYILTQQYVHTWHADTSLLWKTNMKKKTIHQQWNSTLDLLLIYWDMCYLFIFLLNPGGAMMPDFAAQLHLQV